MSSRLTNENIDKLLVRIIQEANALEHNAGLSGSMGDDGASRLREQVKFYRYGIEGTLPSEWEKFQLEFDPEYQEWLRLNQKFGHLK